MEFKKFTADHLSKKHKLRLYRLYFKEYPEEIELRKEIDIIYPEFPKYVQAFPKLIEFSDVIGDFSYNILRIKRLLRIKETNIFDSYNVIQHYLGDIAKYCNRIGISRTMDQLDWLYENESSWVIMRRGDQRKFPILPCDFNIITIRSNEFFYLDQNYNPKLYLLKSMVTLIQLIDNLSNSDISDIDKFRYFVKYLIDYKDEEIIDLDEEIYQLYPEYREVLNSFPMLKVKDIFNNFHRETYNPKHLYKVSKLLNNLLERDKRSLESEFTKLLLYQQHDDEISVEQVYKILSTNIGTKIRGSGYFPSLYDVNIFVNLLGINLMCQKDILQRETTVLFINNENKVQNIRLCL